MDKFKVMMYMVILKEEHEEVGLQRKYAFIDPSFNTIYIGDKKIVKMIFIYYLEVRIMVDWIWGGKYMRDYQKSFW